MKLQRIQYDNFFTCYIGQSRLWYHIQRHFTKGKGVYCISLHALFSPQQSVKFPKVPSKYTPKSVAYVSMWHSV